MKNGKGVEESADGTRFEGSFFNDQKDGAFVEKDRTGRVIRKGIYSRGKLMGGQ
jgi:antitoxin component YwqK of YwqJK toxin-antitoxin module